MWNFPLLPESASTMSGRVDALMLFLLAIFVIFAFGIALTIIAFAIRYHNRREVDRSNPPTFNLAVELVWTAIPLGLVIAMFLGGAHVFVDMHQPPANAIEMYVVGKQWMWKIQHPEGQREINELHIPIDQPVKLLMTSQDVIHSFFVPAFRVKQDVVPGRYTMEWFEAKKPGEYHLFCAQYCGTSHSSMIGRVVAMKPADYASWLGTPVSGTMASSGQHLFHQYGCVSCHRNDHLRRGPELTGLYGQTVRLRGGKMVTADEAYLRESILQPSAKIVDGFQNIMPAYQGQVSEEEALQLIAYIKSLPPLRLDGPANALVAGKEPS
jgi:cytochrome c oxidase subunit II